jgi:hypothetical protein
MTEEAVAMVQPLVTKANDAVLFATDAVNLGWRIDVHWTGPRTKDKAYQWRVGLIDGRGREAFTQRC